MYCHNSLCFQITWWALTLYKSTILCIVTILHVVLFHGYFFYARLIFPIHKSSLTWLPCLPSSFLCVTVTCSTSLGMCAFLQLSLVGLFVISSFHRCETTWSGVLSIMFFSQKNLFPSYNTIYMYHDETIHHIQLLWSTSRVVCGIFFKTINSCSDIWSTLMNSS